MNRSGHYLMQKRLINQFPLIKDSTHRMLLILQKLKFTKIFVKTAFHDPLKNNFFKLIFKEGVQVIF